MHVARLDGFEFGSQCKHDELERTLLALEPELLVTRTLALLESLMGFRLGPRFARAFSKLHVFEKLFHRHGSLDKPSALGLADSFIFYGLTSFLSIRVDASRSIV